MWEEAWYVLTLIGSSYLWAAIGGILFAVFIALRYVKPKSTKRHSLKRFLFILIPTLAITFLLLVSLKATLNIERPCNPCPGEGCNPYCPLDASFPSGHTATIFAGFTSFFVIIREKRFLAFYIVPVLVGISRLTLEVHTWPDVAVGALIGIVVPWVIFEYDRWVFGEFK